MLIFDGGLGTTLDTVYKCDLNNDLWSTKILEENPEIIKQAHQDFVQAGANVIITCTYQTFLLGFKNNVDLFNKSIDTALTMAHEVAQQSNKTQNAKKVLVAGSCGAYGAGLCEGQEYTGDYRILVNGYETVPLLIGNEEVKLSQDFIDKIKLHLSNWHRPRAEQIIKTNKADLLAFETIPFGLEAVACSYLLCELQFPGYVSFTCRNETELGSGEKIKDVLEQIFYSEYLVGIAINCTSLRYISGLVDQIQQFLKEKEAILFNEETGLRPPQMIVYPNSGEIYDGIKKVWLPDSALDGKNFEEMAMEWKEKGVKCIGGCCRVTPDLIQKLATKIKN